MTKPDFVMRKTARTLGGAMRTSHLRTIRSKLMAQGLVLVPSDTCYRLATYAAYEESIEILTSILSLKYSEIHLSAPNFEVALKWIDGRNLTAISLLEQLTPGPITVICSPSSFAQDNAMSITRLSAENSGKVGMRIPDSSIERDVASTNEKYLIASGPVVNIETGEQVLHFEEALSTVQTRITQFGPAGWGAVEGKLCCSGQTSIVETELNGAVRIVREGMIALEQIEASARTIPSTSFEDWG